MAANNKKVSVEKPMMLKVPTAAAELEISESALYELLKAGKIRSVLLGPKIRRIPRTELEAYQQELLDEQYGTDAPERGAA
jgi:excisionase family DNA binding protein